MTSLAIDIGALSPQGSLFNARLVLGGIASAVWLLVLPLELLFLLT